MRVYHRKNFLYGLILAVLGLGLLLVDSLNGFESMSSNAATADREEANDPHTQMVLLKNRAHAFIIHRYVCLGITIILLVVGKVLMSDMLIFMGAGAAIVYAISILLDMATFVFFNHKK